MSHDRIILDMYACTLRPRLWSGVLDQLCEETGACSAVVQAFRFNDAGEVRLSWQAKDTYTQRQSESESRHVASVSNPRFDRHRVMRALNRVVRDDEIFDRHDPARESLRQGLADMGLGDFLGTLQPLPDGRLLGIALHRPADDPRAFDASAAGLLASLAPHFGQACELGHQLGEARAEVERLRQQADMLRFGLITCDARAQVQWMNRNAELLVQQNDGLALRGGILRSYSPALSSCLHEEIVAAAHDAHRSARFLALGEHERRLHIAMRAGALDGQGRCSVMLAVTSLQAAIDVPATAWSKLLGLTAAESALVSALAQGRTLEEHAALRGISLGTVRNQLKQALSKTTTSRQADLVRIALGSAASHLLAPQRGAEH